jgi:hypothetical protein
MQDSGFRNVIDQLNRVRKPSKPVESKPSTPASTLVAITSEGKVMPFESWCRQWVMRWIDGVQVH